MGDLERYFDEVKDLAKDAGEAAKDAKRKAAAMSFDLKEKVQGVLNDTRASRELKLGISELEALPEIDGSIIYRMELETAISYLRNLSLIIEDKRMDDASVVEEITRIMDRVKPADDLSEDASEEDKAIANVKAITYSACARALEVM